MGQIYEQNGQLDLAIDAMAEAMRLGATSVPSRPVAEAAGFDLGRLCLAQSTWLRQQGRLGEALAFYERSLAAYETILQWTEPTHEAHQHAKREFRRLALLDAAQYSEHLASEG